MDVYIDFKSPYAYLSIEPTRKFAQDLNIEINWLPYVLPIPDYLGSATVDDSGKVIQNNRNDHQWRRVRYSYMDCRRHANLRNLTIRGTQKIWNTEIVSKALLWVKNQGNSATRDFIDYVYKNFWERNLDFEIIDNVTDILNILQIESTGFEEWIDYEGEKQLRMSMDKAHQRGVFGVPSYIYKDELFWGREQLPLIKGRITGNYSHVT